MARNRGAVGDQGGEAGGRAVKAGDRVLEASDFEVSFWNTAWDLSMAMELHMRWNKNFRSYICWVVTMPKSEKVY